MSNNQEKVELVKKNIKNYPDFPKPGILFRRKNSLKVNVSFIDRLHKLVSPKDVFSVMSNPEAAEALHDLLITHCTKYIHKIQAICALDSRGFLFGPVIANHLHIPFVPIRKKGKLPGNIQSVAYDLEYGSETFEIQTDALKQGSNVIIVDDLLATGGKELEIYFSNKFETCLASLAAGCKLINKIGSNVDHCIVVVELEELKGRSKIPCPVHSLIKM